MPKSASQVYNHSLTSHKHGFAQFTPEPHDNLPIEYQKVGVSIGDVGILRDGAFDVLFNACWAATHSINGVHGVPDGFEPFLLKSYHISKRAYHSPGSIIAGAKVSGIALNLGASSVVTPFVPITVGSSITYRFQSKEGAILLLPEGASRQDLLPVKPLFAHAKKHSSRWHEFAYDYLPSAGSLFVVTGCDKTSSWGIATASTTWGTTELSLKFTVAGIAEGNLAPRYQWRDFGSATVRTSTENWRTENQCIFVRGFIVPRNIPILTSIANKIMSRGLERDLARCKQGAQRRLDEVGHGMYLESANRTLSETYSEVPSEESEIDASAPGIQILPCD